MDNFERFQIIPNQQTPSAPRIEDVQTFIMDNLSLLIDFSKYVSVNTNAVGLAANQVSVYDIRLNIRVFALRNLDNNTWKLVINPVINKYIGIKEFKTEGCLTWINKIVVAERSRAVEVSYYDVDGKLHENEIYRGFEGQIWQHEINHLNGIEEQVENFGFKLPKPLDIGRNEKCPCGSGKKYKQCCLI